MIDKNKLKIVVGHGLGLRLTRKELNSKKIREQYRADLSDARKKHGDWIPFGYNLDLLKKDD